MKKLNLLLAAVFLCASISNAQVTVTFKPGPAAGVDAEIMTSYGCIMSNQTVPMETINMGGAAESDYIDWTYNAIGCSHGTTRSLITFTGLSTIPAGATILSATLNMYGVPTSGNYGNSSFPGSPYGTTNEGWVQRVTSSWAENTVTWNTQPSATTTNEAALPVTTSQFGFNASVNVTALVQDIISSGSNNGFMLLLQNEAIYRAVLFASSDHSDPTLWPELVVTYSTCFADFTYCASTSSPYKYTFSDDNPQPGDMSDWYVDGNPVGSGTPFTFDFGGAGQHKICQMVTTQQGDRCEKCIALCIADNGKPQSDGTAAQKAGTAPTVMPLQLAPEKIPVTDKAALQIADITPNPTNAGWSVTVKSEISSEADITIYDLKGNILRKEHRKLERGDNKVTEAGEKMGTGVYLIEVKTATMTIKERLQKL
ncbi:DNRLRE domain-containing protein [Chitinophagaceae bacterium MMS25-I14]